MSKENDQKYLDLMSLYKKLRRSPKTDAQSQKVLDKALKFSKDNAISPEALEAARYF